MAEKPKDDKSAKSQPKGEKKTSDTVNLSAEELRKISGGPTVKTPDPQK